MPVNASTRSVGARAGCRELDRVPERRELADVNVHLGHHPLRGGDDLVVAVVVVDVFSQGCDKTTEGEEGFALFVLQGTQSKTRELIEILPDEAPAGERRNGREFAVLDAYWRTLLSSAGCSTCSIPLSLCRQSTNPKICHAPKCVKATRSVFADVMKKDRGILNFG